MAGVMAADPDLRRRVFFGSRPNFREEEKKVAGGFFFAYRRPTFAGGVFILWDVDFLRRQRFLQDIDWKGGYFLQEADVRRKIFFRKQILKPFFFFCRRPVAFTERQIFCGRYVRTFFAEGSFFLLRRHFLTGRGSFVGGRFSQEVDFCFCRRQMCPVGRF